MKNKASDGLGPALALTIDLRERKMSDIHRLLGAMDGTIQYCTALYVLRMYYSMYISERQLDIGPLVLFAIDNHWYSLVKRR